jgi:tRNA 2-thiouridine synthesizing protein A
MSDTAGNDTPGACRPDLQLDVCGTLCPIPVVRARQALKSMQAGQVLEVLATDPLAELDLAVMCQHGGHELLVAETLADGRLRLLIRAG